nr:MAG TPA: hypothetical protein [Caudoviricetes sp.]
MERVLISPLFLGFSSLFCIFVVLCNLSRQ